MGIDSDLPWFGQVPSYPVDTSIICHSPLSRFKVLESSCALFGQEKKWAITIPD